MVMEPPATCDPDTTSPPKSAVELTDSGVALGVSPEGRNAEGSSIVPTGLVRHLYDTKP